MTKRIDRLTVETTIDWHQKKGSRRHVLQWLIENNNFESMVEIGVRYGGTTFHLLDHFPNLKIYGIDTDITQFYNSEIEEKYGDRLIAIQGMSENVSDMIPNDSVDIIFIDGNHDYRYVKNDILLYKSKIKQGGILSGHDIDYPGVNRAVTELVEHYDIAPNFVWFTKI